MTIGWYHQTYQTGEWDGFNDSGIETFREDPLPNLARETIQNAVDARLSSDAPITVSFDINHIKPKTIPGFEQFSQTLQQCAKEKSNKGNEKANSFFQNALSIIKKDKLTVLTITDSNTTGIKGPCTNETAYHAFMKAKGLSHKESDVASGSYGIGKLAPYAVSELRTVFVSTIYENEGKLTQLTQGKTILTSHMNSTDTKSAIGFWGETAGCLPLEGVPDVANWLLNAENVDGIPHKQGTKLAVLGFDAAAHWQEILACSVVINFFGAIAQGDLIVNIGDKYALNKNSISDFFGSKEIGLFVDSPSQATIDPDAFKNAHCYYRALNASQENILESQKLNLKHCQLNLVVEEGLPKKVCLLRNGMFITDSLKGLIRFSDYKDFVAVFQCVNDEGNKLLRSMEPPTHSNFIPNLLAKDEVKKGKKALDEIVIWIKKELRDKARDPVSDKTLLDELKDLLGDEDISGSHNKGEEINPLGRMVYQGKPIKITPHRPSPVASIEVENVDFGDNTDEGSGGGGGTGSGGGSKSGGRGNIPHSGSGGGTSMGSFVEINNLRAPIVAGGQRKLSFTPTTSGKISLMVYGAGADVDYPIPISQADQGTVVNGNVELECSANNRITILVDLSESFNGAIKVVANEIR